MSRQIDELNENMNNVTVTDFRSKSKQKISEIVS